ncbi:MULTISPECIES: wax ester/triacylglycerol synthase family O-acyltransferase [unclassified Rhodococcus (in: high G+C Gram-positive bacteria)]|uniref:WS/DGAT/MGAT family O-acyltransferase n=1 Tax=Rhodococcus sp. SJ-3 TaxID=3454628 RepID=UPI003F7A5287
MLPTDSMFLLGESREHPMHVGGLILFTPPDGGDAPDMRAAFDRALGEPDADPLWRKRPVRSFATLGQWAWEEDEDFDLAYHVRYDALPTPGGHDELWTLVSRLHGTLLNRDRPLWEMHLIEGLADGRFAVYTKIHHALADGVGAMKLLRRAMSADSDRIDMPAPWAPVDALVPARSEETLQPPADSVIGAARAVASQALGLVPALSGTVDRAVRGRGGSLSLRAPNTVVNVPISGARRCAGRTWPLKRLRAVATAAGATVNDVVLAMSSGALRSFLLDQNALPDRPLVAMVPVSLRPDKQCSGNQVGVLMCNLATGTADPVERLVTIRESTTQGKDAMRGMPSVSRLATSALGVAPLAVGMITGNRALLRPPFNIIISNVSGPAHPLYWNGARVDAVYPLSVPVDGQALNITCTSTDDDIAFGLTSCSRTVPKLERLLDLLGAELDSLERAFE